METIALGAARVPVTSVPPKPYFLCGAPDGWTMEVFFGQVHRGYHIRGSPQYLLLPPLPPHTGGPFSERHNSCPQVCALSECGSKFILMLIEIKLAVHFVGSKGCICSLGGEVHLVNFHRVLARAITLSSFVSSPDRFYSALIPPGPCCHNFIGFMATAELPCAIV